MKTPDERILRLIEVLKFQKNIKTLNEFCDEIGIIRQSVYKIRKGEMSFTTKQINVICNKYKVNANWIFGIETNVFLTKNSMVIP